MFIPKRLELTNITTHENTVYEYRQGVPILVVGDNRDDPGQKSNGAGKSGLMEGPAIAITGSSVRNVSNKEIVRRGCESGEIVFILENTMYRCELKIWRKLYAGKKSAEVKVYENGVEVVRSDVNEYNKVILEFLGISKEDFFNFYLLTRMTYSPFFVVGDTKKKEIINRFSGADKVDITKALVDIDLDQLRIEASTAEKAVNGNVGKQQLLNEQIEAERKLFSPESIIDRLSEKQVELDNAIKAAEKQQEVVTEAESAVELANFNKSMFVEQPYDLKIIAEKNDKIALQKILNEKELSLKTISDKYYKLKIPFAIQEETASNTLADKRLGFNEAVKLQAEFEKQLAGVIECPNCQHKFTLQDKEYNHEEALQSLEEIKQIVIDIQSDITTFTKTVIDHQQKQLDLDQQQVNEQAALSSEMNSLNEQMIQISNKINTWNDKKNSQERTKKDLDNKVTDTERDLQQKNIKLEELTNKAIIINEEMERIESGQSDKLLELEAQLIRYSEQSEGLTNTLQEALDKIIKKEEWITNFKNFKSYLANQSIANIQDYTNMYLQKMGTNLSVAIDGYRVLSTGKLKEEISITIVRDGLEEASYGTFSAGERARVDLAVILAMQSLINLNATSGGIDLIFCDEVFDSVDGAGMEAIMKGLEHVDRTIMIVSQVSINTLVDNTITIRKENKISKVIL